MRIGMVCPYSFDVPGGVQAHVVELAHVFIERGHEVSVLTPAAGETDLPDYVVRADAPKQGKVGLDGIALLAGLVGEEPQDRRHRDQHNRQQVPHHVTPIPLR